MTQSEQYEKETVNTAYEWLNDNCKQAFQEYVNWLEAGKEKAEKELIARDLRDPKLVMSDYSKAKELGLTSKNRWEDGINHHLMSKRLVRFLADHDFYDYGDRFCWKVGGDGDNGETLMFQMDAFFEMLDKEIQ